MTISLFRSAIIFPEDKEVIIHTGKITMKGWAYSGGGNWVERVEVSPDGLVLRILLSNVSDKLSEIPKWTHMVRRCSGRYDREGKPLSFEQDLPNSLFFLVGSIITLGASGRSTCQSTRKAGWSSVSGRGTLLTIPSLLLCAPLGSKQSDAQHLITP